MTQSSSDTTRNSRPIKRSRSTALTLFATILLGVLSPQPAFAACTTPAGEGGDQFFNTTVSRMQYCDGTNWINMGVSALSDNLGNHIATTGLRSDTNNTDDLGTSAIRWKDGWFAGALTAGSFSGVGSLLTDLNASNITAGTVPAARLGTGTADSTTFLRGDNTWASVSSSVWLNDGPGGPAEVYYNAGYVGIGTNDPQRTLGVSASGSSTSGYIGIEIENNSPGGAGWNLLSSDSSASAVGGGSFSIWDRGAAEHRFVIRNTGNVGIGDSNPSTKLEVAGTVTATAFVGDGSGLTNLPGGGGLDNLGNHIATTDLRSDTNNSDDLGTTAIRWKDGWFAGAVTAAGDMNAAAYNHTSDARLKTNVIAIEDPTDIISALRGVRFEWIKSGKPAYGFIAQEVEKTFPEAVTQNAEGMMAVEYDQIIAPLLEAVKAQELRILTLERELSQLRKEQAE